MTWIIFDNVNGRDSPESIVSKILDCKKDKIRIIAPLLTSAAMTKQSSSFFIYLDIPNAVIKKDPPEIKEIVEKNIKIYVPDNKDKPFLNLESSQNPYELKTIDFKRISRDDKSESIDVNRLYKGTKDAVDVTKIVSNPNEHSFYSIYPSDGGPIVIKNLAYTSDEDYQVSLNLYLRKYLGILEECDNVYRVEVKPSKKIAPGVYLLKVEGVDDEKVHPLRVFEDSKSKYEFSHITDLHLAKRYDDVENYLPKDVLKKYVNPNKSFTSFAEKLNMSDFIIITGDLVEYANDHRPYESDFIMDGNWMYAENVIRKYFSVPIFVALGNHDYRHNAVSVPSMTSDLNISKDEAKQYPRDGQQDIIKWAASKCLEDSLFCDENALQYYFYNFCPFYDYAFKLDKLSFIFLDTKCDQFAFMADYPRKDLEMTAEYVASISLGSNPAPILSGLLDEQTKFVDSCLDNTGVLFMHAALINVPSAIPDPIVAPSVISSFEDWKHEYIPEMALDADVISSIIKKREEIILELTLHIDSIPEITLNDYSTNEKILKLVEQIIENKKIFNFFKAIRDGGIYYDRNIYLGKDKKTYFDESSVMNLRDEIIKRMRSNTKLNDTKLKKPIIKLVVVGHVHKNLEFKLKFPEGEKEQMRWYYGEFSSREGENKPLEDAPYTVATVSGGYLGYRWIKKDDKSYEDNDIDGYKREYYGTGYRNICISSEGKIESMKIFERKI